jgi:uncharacterized protein (DUF2141 family)
MAALIALVTLVPITIAVIASVWSDFQSVQDTIENRKLDANNFGMPSSYHTLYDETRGSD